MDENFEVEVPSHFLCPISLQIMKEPVTLTTGITYDRDNIEKWLFSFNNKTCPVTNQSLNQHYLTPNHNLRRLIQSWCNIHSSSTINMIPNSNPLILYKTQTLNLLSQANSSLECLQKLRSFVFESESNKIRLKSAGAIHFLASTTLKKNLISEGVGSAEVSSRGSNSIIMNNNNDETYDPQNEAEMTIEILFHLNPSETEIKILMCDESIEFMDSLIQILRHGNYQSRAYATMLLQSALGVADSLQMMTIRPEIFVELARVVKDEISQKATKAAVKAVVELCAWGKNRVKAAEGGVVWVLVEKLMGAWDRRVCEAMMTALDRVCGCAEGRAELVRHAAGVAVVAKKILRVSHVASDRGVRILRWVCKYLGSGRVIQEMMDVGAVAKLCMVVQLEGNLKTKERAKEILILHSRVWRNSSCIPLSLFQSYPSS